MMPHRQTSRIVFGMACLGAVAMLFFYQSRALSYVILYALVLLFLAALASVLAAPRCLYVAQNASVNVVAKHVPFFYKTKLRNRGPLPYPLVEVEHHCPDLDQYGLSLASSRHLLGARASVLEEHRIRFPYRGVYQLGVGQVHVHDFLGLFHYGFRLPALDRLVVTVYPELDPQFALPLLQEPQTNLTFDYDFQQDPKKDVHELREYMPDDDYRKIHWKLSAKKGEFIVKEYPTSSQVRTLLFLDPLALPLERRAKAHFEDGLTGLVASAVFDCCQNETAHDLIYGAPTERLHIEPAENMERVLELLARLPFRHGASQLLPFLQSLDLRRRNTDLVLFLTSLDTEGLTALKSCRLAGLRVLLYFVAPAQLPPDAPTQNLLQQLQELGGLVETVTLEEEVITP